MNVELGLSHVFLRTMICHIVSLQPTRNVQLLSPQQDLKRSPRVKTCSLQLHNHHHNSHHHPLTLLLMLPPTVVPRSKDRSTSVGERNKLVRPQKMSSPQSGHDSLLFPGMWTHLQMQVMR